MAPEREEGHVESNITYSWVGLKDGNDSQLNKHEEHGMFPRKEKKKDYVSNWMTELLLFFWFIYSELQLSSFNAQYPLVSLCRLLSQY